MQRVMSRLSCLVSFLILLTLAFAGRAHAGPKVICLTTPKNTAFYLRNCCPQPCPVYDQKRHAANLAKLEVLQQWAAVSGMTDISLRLLLAGVGQPVASLPLVSSPLVSYRPLEDLSIRSCLPPPRELVENGLITPYTDPPEPPLAFLRRAFAYSLQINTENAPLHLSSVTERIGRRHCRAKLQENYALQQMAVAMSAQSTLRAFQAKLYEYIRLAAASGVASCTPASSELGQYLSWAQSAFGQAFGSAEMPPLPEQPGCLRQDISLNTQLRADQALLRTYVIQMKTLYNMGTVFGSLPGQTEFGN